MIVTQIFAKVSLKKLKGLEKLIQKLDVVATVIFILIDVKGESKTKKQQQYNFCYDHI